MNIRWRILYNNGCLYWEFYEGDEPRGTLWSMGIAYDTIDSLDEMKLVDNKKGAIK
jgi:hypothetical protein